MQIPGFKLFHKTRKKYHRLSGGIAIAVKSYIVPYIKIIESESEYVLWAKIDRKISKLSHDIMLGCCYIPPNGSDYNNPEAIDEIQSEIITHFNSEAPIILLGDFNSKTKQVNDIVDTPDEDNFNNCCSHTTLPDIKKTSRR